MQSLILIVEHRRCQCGATFLAPNPRTLTKSELVNLKATRAKIFLPRRDCHYPHIPLREVIHTTIDIDACPQCFLSSNGTQFELFPEKPPPELIFTAGEVQEKKPPPPNPFGLGYF